MLDGVRNNLLRGWPLIIIISVCALPFVFLGTGSLGTIFGSNYGSVNGEQVEEIDIQVAKNRVIQNKDPQFGGLYFAIRLCKFYCCKRSAISLYSLALASLPVAEKILDRVFAA